MRNQDNIYGYIYKTTNLINGKIYIGQKKSSKFLESMYLGSEVRLKEAVKKYGEENFSVELIEYCNSQKELDSKEVYYIEKFNSMDKEIGYNLCRGGHSYRNISKSREMMNEKRDQTMLARYGEKHYRPLRHNKVLMHNQKINRNKWVNKDKIQDYEKCGWIRGGKPLQTTYTEERRKQIGERLKKSNTGRSWVCVYNKNLNIVKHIDEKDVEKYSQEGWIIHGTRRGFKRSEETKKKLSELNKNKVGCNAGKIIINNGSIEKYVSKDEIIPAGFCKGRLPRSNEHIKHLSEANKGCISNSKGKIYMFKDEIEKRITPENVEEYIQNGWQIGTNPRIKRIKITNDVEDKIIHIIDYKEKEVLDYYLKQGYRLGGKKRISN